MTTFENAFKALTGTPPFPWQQALYHEWFAAGKIPETCNLPTGLGKTSVITIWMIALASFPDRMPKRLVYVVNRRTVVDQTTDEAEKLRRNIESPDLKDLRKQLGGTLAISTLRGQFADKGEWSADPSRPAVICGTVDMIGSRLLFSGYGVGFKAKPLHAGFIGQDVLLVHDEAHLEPAFQTLLEGIEEEQRRYANEKGKFRVMALSATTRATSQKGKQNRTLFELTSADREHPVVSKRIHAVKKLILTPQTNKIKLGEQLAATAIERFKDSGRPILIFVRLVEDLKQVLDRLRKDKLAPIQLTGTMRGWERMGLLTDPRFVRFLPESNRPKDIAPREGTVFLVCTSAGEVGVNISADHLVCDLSTFESMAQRFGRVNRFGLHADSEIHVIHPQLEDFKDEAPDLQRKRTLELLKDSSLEGNASPDALAQLDASARAEAFAPIPTILPTTDILFDAWSMTSIRDRMPGRPHVEPYLHGIREWEPPETHVAWREEVGAITGDLLSEYPPRDLLDEYSLKPHELLRDRSDRVWAELEKLAAWYPLKPLWIVDEQGTVEVVSHLAELSGKDKKVMVARLKDKTVIGGAEHQGVVEQIQVVELG